VAAILAKVRRDTIGSRLLARECGGDRIRFVSPSCLTNRGYVVNVDEQSLVRGVHGSGRFSGLASSSS
jgi:hypothetical protein